MAQASPKKAYTIKALNLIKQELVSEGLMTGEQLEAAEKMAKNREKLLGKVLVNSGFISEDQLASFIGKKINVPYVDISNYTIDKKTLDRVPKKFAIFYNMLPLFEIEGVLTIAMQDPLDILSLDEIESLLRFKVEAVLATETSLKMAIAQWYDGAELKKDLIDTLADELTQIKADEEGPEYKTEIDSYRLQKEAEEPPIIKLVNGIIAQAVLDGASDIHFEPKKNSLDIRYRIDGLLYHLKTISTSMQLQIISRIKIMSRMDITIRRVPQDGRISASIRDRQIDLRVSSYPSLYGENIVLRILDKSRGVPSLATLGFSDQNYSVFKKLLMAPNGIILATGPTGSGKTTTILSALKIISVPDKCVMTVEDPIEYEINDIVQSQVNAKTNFTFPKALKSILRQDPDIIYIGEIRDLETAKIATNAALTGHLVLSTLHTNDAVGAVTRLLDLGVERGMLSYSLNCSFAQRLVRVNCPRCSKQYQPDEFLIDVFKPPPDTKFMKGEGCDACKGVGYKGRTGVFEIMPINNKIKRLIANEGSLEGDILTHARQQGMRTLLEDGLEKVAKGITTLEELRRVLAE
jgi:type II secretory ATPase GspE/PulE/Tfp pilus assembly ATPase PilB-like protein